MFHKVKFSLILFLLFIFIYFLFFIFYFFVLFLIFIFILFFFNFFIYFSFRNNREQFNSGMRVTLLRFIYLSWVSMKVISFLCIELLFGPYFSGTLVNFFSVRYFGSSFASRFEFYLKQFVLLSFFHWFIGMIFNFIVGTFFRYYFSCYLLFYFLFYFLFYYLIFYFILFYLSSNLIFIFILLLK